MSEGACTCVQVHAHLDKWKRLRQHGASAMLQKDVRALLQKTVRSRDSADTSILPGAIGHCVTWTCVLHSNITASIGSQYEAQILMVDEVC